MKRKIELCMTLLLLLGMIFASFIAPIADSFGSLILTWIELQKGKLTVEITKLQVEIQKMAIPEEEEETGRVIGFATHNDYVEDYETDLDFYLSNVKEESYLKYIKERLDTRKISDNLAYYIRDAVIYEIECEWLHWLDKRSTNNWASNRVTELDAGYIDGVMQYEVHSY